MCSHSRYIRNPTVSYKSGVSPISVNIPCNDCEVCRSNEKNDWFLRCYAEFLRCKEQFGKCIFFTLTYRNADLPRFIDYGVQSYQSCFSKRDIDTFVKNLHHYFTKYFGSSEGLRYFIAGEYGKHTKRPHYHGQAFFPFRPNLNVPLLKKIVEKSWSHGFVLWSREDKGGAEVLNETAIRYNSKYVCKDVSFYQLPEIVRLVDLMRPFRSAAPGSVEKNTYNNFRNCLPRHYQSKLFGYEVLKRLFVDELDDDGNYILSDKLDYTLSKGYRIPMTTQIYRIPRYVLNRLCYDTDRDGHRYVNKVGKEILTRIMINRVEKMAVDLNHAFTTLGIKELCDERDFEKCFCADDSLAHFPKGSSKICNALALQDTVYKLLGSRPWYYVALYDVVFRDRCFLPYLNDIKYFHLSDVVDVADSIVFETYHKPNTRNFPKDTPCFTHRPKLLSNEKLTLFNSLSVFDGFDAILAIYKQLQRWSAEHRKKAAEKKDAEASNLKDFFNSFNVKLYA